MKDLAGYIDAQKLISGEQGAVSYLLHHPISTLRLAKMAWDGAKVVDPLFAKYFSSAPYLLGAEAAKYQLVPCSPEKITPPAKGQNSLRAAIAAHLKAGPACLAILAQRFIDEKKTPIENFAKEWTSAVAPPVKVATVTFTQQTFDTPAQNKFCEDLSFNPWRTLPNQRPLGSLNRVRKAIYEAVAARRHQDNHAQRKEPDGTEKF